MIPAAATPARILVVGSDAELLAVLHAHAPSAGWLLYTAPGPGDLELLLQAVAPSLVVLLLPAAPDASWGSALTASQGAARDGVRVFMVAPSREVVGPLAAVAGAERAISRADLLARPATLSDPGPVRPRPVTAPQPAPPPPAPPPPPPPPPVAAPLPRGPAIALPTLADPDELPSRPSARPPPDLMSLIDEELVEVRPRPPMANTRVEVAVSLVSEHNFYVGATRRIDSGGVFIATSMPPPVGTPVQLRLGLADGRKIDLDGVVVFQRPKSATTGRQPGGCGVRLSGMPGWVVDAVERFFQARLPIIHGPT